MKFDAGDIAYYDDNMVTIIRPLDLQQPDRRTVQGYVVESKYGGRCTAWESDLLTAAEHAETVS